MKEHPVDEYGSYHLVGAGGSGMSGLARLLLGAGRRVTGSDRTESAALDSLRALGATIVVGHDARNIGDAECVIYTAAVGEDNPELAAARAAGVPLVKRSEMLGQLLSRKRAVAITGTHGKTTTTAMAASVFLASGVDPSVLVGGDWGPIGGNARAGAGPHFLAEACEAYNSFLEIRPDVALITNVEADHLDWHGSLEGVIQAFRKFLDQLRPGGYLISCADDELASTLAREAGCRSVSYGFSPSATWRVGRSSLDSRTPSFVLERGGEVSPPLVLGVPGRHNVLNAAGVAALAREEGLAWEGIAAGLRDFTGVGRRMEKLGEVGGVMVIDDYAHHPTEIAVTLDALDRAYGRPLTVVFQPHLFSRTQQLAGEFERCFGKASRLFIAEIYPAREQPIPGVTGEWLAGRVRSASPDLEVSGPTERDRLVEQLSEQLLSGDIAVFMGAGDIVETGRLLVSRLEQVRGKERAA